MTADTPAAQEWKRHPCPICGDLTTFALWIEREPPTRCPYEPETTSPCAYMMQKAAQQALFRRLVPDAYDSHGNLKAGQLERVLTAWAAAEPNGVLFL